jgi:hypothetical protein
MVGQKAQFSELDTTPEDLVKEESKENCRNQLGIPSTHTKKPCQVRM